MAYGKKGEKNLACLHAPKNPKKVRASMDHVGGHPKLASPRMTKRGRKGASKRALSKGY